MLEIPYPKLKVKAKKAVQPDITTDMDNGGGGSVVTESTEDKGKKVQRKVDLKKKQKADDVFESVAETYAKWYNPFHGVVINNISCNSF